MKFWEAVDYKNARKVLVIPNITNSSNIEKDSFIDVIYNHIKSLDKCGEYFWNVLVPKGNVYLKLVVKDKWVFLVNPKNESDYIEFEHTDHFNFIELNRAIDFNRTLLKKIK